jgi:hypothetical protein
MSVGAISTLKSFGDFDEGAMMNNIANYDEQKRRSRGP